MPLGGIGLFFFSLLVKGGRENGTRLALTLLPSGVMNMWTIIASSFLAKRFTLLVFLICRFLAEMHF